MRDLLWRKKPQDKDPWKLWRKLWTFASKEANNEDWMFLHPLIAISLTKNFMKTVLNEMGTYRKL